MEIQLIKDLSSFKKIRNDWEQVYQDDSNAQIYISWLWLYCSFLDTPDKWVIIGVKDRPEGSFIAFLPLSESAGKLSKLLFINKYIYPGNPISSYAGFLCRHDTEEKVIPFLTSYLKSHLEWDIIYLKWLRDIRIQSLLSNFPKNEYLLNVQKEPYSLRISLPVDYNSFLTEFMGRDTRQNIRRKTRRLINGRDCMIVNSTAETIDRDINAICILWNNQWQKKQIMNRHMNVLDQFFKEGILRLTTIWDGETLVAGLAGIADQDTSTFNAYITAYDSGYSKYSPGLVVVAESINLAIQEKLKYYDFTIGLDPYKMSFGAERLEISAVLIKKRNLKTRLKLSLLGLIQKIK